jgi:hypothetical protein
VLTDNMWLHGRRRSSLFDHPERPIQPRGPSMLASARPQPGIVPRQRISSHDAPLAAFLKLTLGKGGKEQESLFQNVGMAGPSPPTTRPMTPDCFMRRTKQARFIHSSSSKARPEKGLLLVELLAATTSDVRSSAGSAAACSLARGQ